MCLKRSLDDEVVANALAKRQRFLSPQRFPLAPSAYQVAHDHQRNLARSKQLKIQEIQGQERQLDMSDMEIAGLSDKLQGKILEREEIEAKLEDNKTELCRLTELFDAASISTNAAQAEELDLATKPSASTKPPPNFAPTSGMDLSGVRDMLGFYNTTDLVDYVGTLEGKKDELRTVLRKLHVGHLELQPEVREKWNGKSEDWKRLYGQTPTIICGRAGYAVYLKRLTEYLSLEDDVEDWTVFAK